jgi:hypothetical protein
MSSHELKSWICTILLAIAVLTVIPRSGLAQGAAPPIVVPKTDKTLIRDMPKKEEPSTDKSVQLAGKADQPAEAAPRKSPADPSVTLKQLGENVWVDLQNKQVFVDGQICLTRGMLEMFAVPKGTKEHESIVSLNTKAQVVHAGLLAVGAVPGTTVKFQPKFAPATGPKVDVYVYWTDDKGKQQKARAQDWVRDIKTKKAMDTHWVFAGSGFYVDPDSKKNYYLAEAGDLICVSNFPDATLDVPVESTDSNDDLEYEAFSEHIPPRGTKVTIGLAPEIEKNPAPDKKTK